MSKRDVSDEQNERNKRVLTLLLKQEDNKHCVDCRTRNPTWASVNIGCFMCLTCSGIHRSLGVHISQVRSTNLDTWLPKQVEFIRHVGNDRVNKYWEADLPANFRRPPGGQPNNDLGAFIRAKYAERRYAARDAPPPAPDNYLDHPYIAVVAQAQPAAPAAPRPAPLAAPPAALAPVAAAPQLDFLGLDVHSSPKAAASAGAAAAADPFAALAGGSAPAAAAAPAAAEAAPSPLDEWDDFASAAGAVLPAAPTPAPALAAPADPFAALVGGDLVPTTAAAAAAAATTAAAAAAPSPAAPAQAAAKPPCKSRCLRPARRRHLAAAPDLAAAPELAAAPNPRP
jgi:stromal membrane-associated protein